MICELIFDEDWITERHTREAIQALYSLFEELKSLYSKWIKIGCGRQKHTLMPNQSFHLMPIVAGEFRCWAAKIGLNWS